MCRSLHARQHEAVAVGIATAPSAIQRLAAWADKIIVMETAFAAYIPEAHRSRLEINDVGPDVWVNPYNQALRALCDAFCQAKGW